MIQRQLYLLLTQNGGNWWVGQLYTELQTAVAREGGKGLSCDNCSEIMGMGKSFKK